MSDVHPTAVTDNGDPVGIIAGIRISACTGIVCSRPSLPGTMNRPGMSGDSSSWKGWGHVRWFIEE
ncbi:hypothetical protein, partial [Mycobacterium tuberculosis]|uniref:hypothetical protein n=1 Tax=Mycobacterium tuberculosis TaxID=1773 RepID=UPI00099EEFA0